MVDSTPSSPIQQNRKPTLILNLPSSSNSDGSTDSLLLTTSPTSSASPPLNECSRSNSQIALSPKSGVDQSLAIRATPTPSSDRSGSPFEFDNNTSAIMPYSSTSEIQPQPQLAPRGSSTHTPPPFRRDSLMKLQQASTSTKSRMFAIGNEHEGDVERLTMSTSQSSHAGPSTRKPNSNHQLPSTPPSSSLQNSSSSSYTPENNSDLSYSSSSRAVDNHSGSRNRMRRPLSSYPARAEGLPYLPPRKYTDPTPRTHRYEEEDSPNMNNDPNNHQDLDDVLDAYSTTEYEGEGEEGERDGTLGSRAPTLSFVTTSTVDSATSTPPMGVAYGFRQGTPDDKAEVEPRIRMRTTAGRTNAYSSAESSMASGAYSIHGYPDAMFHHPHPPPMPSLPDAYATDQVGLGISSHDIILPVQARLGTASIQASPIDSYDHRPWRRDHLRSESVSSSITTTSVSTDDEAGPSVHRESDSPSNFTHYPFNGYNLDERLPWEREASQQEHEAKAVAMFMEGKSKVLDEVKLEEIGGLDALTEDVIDTLAGITHLVLPGIGSNLLPVLPSLLMVLAPTLVVLDISDNDLSFLPESLRQCSALEELNVSGNIIRQLPLWIGELGCLRMLAVDRCGLPSLSSEISKLINLHTLCARKNRLISLPPWLCLLPLENLRVDENPFAAEWKSVVSPILASSSTVAPPPIPARGSSYRKVAAANGLKEAISTASFTSSLTSSSIASHAMRTSTSSASGSELWMSPSNTSPSIYMQPSLNPIVEDHPQSAPVRDERNDEEEVSPKGLRKMRSAGNLLGGQDRKTSVSGASVSTIPHQRAPSLGKSTGRRVTSVAGNFAEEPSLTSSMMTPSTSGKGGKWGFLRKMSMNRLKGDKNTMAASAAANLSTLPMAPPMQHQHSAPIASLPSRPSISGTRSAMTLPTRKMFGGSGSGDVNEFGLGLTPSGSSTLPLNGGLPGLPAPSSLFGNAGNGPVPRGKRRSFLPIDGPPSINISIPSTSPFMGSAMFPHVRGPSQDTTHLPVADSQETIADDTMTPSSSQLHVDTASLHEDAEIRYANGLDSIKSYLRDLYDLSRPIVEPYGSFEVVGSAASASFAPASEHPSSPASFGRNSVSEARRARTGTLESQLSRQPSTISSVGFSERGSTIEVETSKKFKDDKGKRARVIREVYETERTYVRGLGELVSIYVKPAGLPVKAGQPETTVPAAERKIVFGGVESILSIHRDNLLPALEKAVKPLLEGEADDDGELSTSTAHAVGEVFRTYIAYMKQYSTYSNNFENALSRMKTWSVPTSGATTPIYPSKSSGLNGGIGAAAASFSVIAAPSMGVSDSAPRTGTTMTTSQKKRVKNFLKKSREHPKHSQINLESYLLLPIQRIPRYKLLLEDLAMCTPARMDGPKDALDDSLNEIANLASAMNEEKRDADNRLRLFHWQQRITTRGPSPLVQPHRKLILDGALNLVRIVKKTSTYVEVENQLSLTSLQDGDSTIMPAKAVVPVEYIAPEPMEKPVMLILCSDLMIVTTQRPDSHGWEGLVDLLTTLRLPTLREPASIVNGNVLRVVDNKSIYYFNSDTPEGVVTWCRAINTARKR